MSDTLRTECYLIIPADENRRGDKKLMAPYTRKTKPDLARNEVALKLRIEIPRSIFENLIPEAELVVPEGYAIRPKIEVGMEPVEEGRSDG